MDRNKKIIKASFLGIILNFILVIFKSIVGFIANSISIILDAINNFSDAISQIIIIIGTKISGKKPTKKHPFGFGRVEYVTTQIVAAIIIAVGVISLKESIEKIINPSEANYSIYSLIIISGAIFVKLFYGLYARILGKKYKSEPLIGTAVDSFFDAILSISTLICAIISMNSKYILEGYVGSLISIMIIRSGLELLFSSITTIIGKRADNETTTNLKKFIKEYDNVKGVYDLVLHDYGVNNIMGSANIELPDEITTKEIHWLTRKISEDVYKNYGIIMYLGIYASNDSDKDSINLKEMLNNFIKEHDEIKEIHAISIDNDNKKISFDVIFSFDCENSKELLNQIRDDINNIFKDYTVDIVIDTDYSD